VNDLSIPEGLEGLVTTGAQWGARIVGVLLVVLLAWTLAGAVRRSIVRACERRGLDATLGRFFANLSRYAILTGALLGCLGAFGIETTSFAALFAAMGLAIGLAFQGTLSNFAAGAMLLAFRPFKVGDVIRTNGEIGTVAELELFTTELTTADNRRLIIPNAKVFGDTIENITHHPTRRVEIPVGVSYSADLKRCRETLLAAATDVSGVLEEPAPQAFLSELGDSSVNWKVRAWCSTADFWRVHDALVEAIKARLDGASIEIPFPQMDVHVDK
jgi:small conductance mechanosensitive channel